MMLMTKEDKRISVDRLIPLIDVKRALAISWPFLVNLIHEGKLDVCDISGQTVKRSEVDQRSRGLRVPEASLKKFIDSIKVR